MLSDKRLIRSMRLRNFLSFGEASESFEMKSLNVLIGPNSSGKSNLLEAIGLLAASPKDLIAPIREGGGVAEWLWKGQDRASGQKTSRVAEIGVTVEHPGGSKPLRHLLSFTMTGQRFELSDELVEHEGNGRDDASCLRFFYHDEQSHPVLGVSPPAGFSPEKELVEQRPRRDDWATNQSVLSQIRDPDRYPEITYLGKRYSDMRLYREWNLGRYTPPRMPQKTDLPGDWLLEDASNLGLVLNDLEHKPGRLEKLREKLKAFQGSFTDVTTRIEGGTVQVFLHEEGLGPIPATRLSDGTLRYLCLLTLLCHPSPPPVICIEEPELGLHPDVLPDIAELLLEASERTQLFVTTHSDILVDALSDTPEAVVVCEKQDGATTMKRLSRDDLSAWLEKYSLGQLWRRGDLGGNRW